MGSAQSKTVQNAPKLVGAGFAVLRTPLLPFEEFEKWSSLAIAQAAADQTVCIESNRARHADHSKHPLELLRAFVGTDAFTDAIKVASPALHRALSEWLSGRGKTERDRLEQSLIRYFGRATFRTTPFGLFAGCSLMRIGDSSDFTLCDRTAYSRHSRLDMDHIAELSRAIIADPLSRQHLPLFRNSSAAEIGGRLHYVEARYVNRFRQYALTAVEPIPEIRELLDAAREGVTFEALADRLRTDGFEDEEINEFLNELVDTQLLIPAVEPNLTGPEAAQTLAKDLRDAGFGTEIELVLRQVISKLAEIDAAGVGCRSDQYDEALSPLSTLSVPVDPSKILQVDLFKPSPELTLGSTVVSDAIEAAEILAAASIRIERMVEFAARFEERYETLEVPLLEVLDDEVGIGFPDADRNDRVMRRFLERMRQRDLWLGELRARAERHGTRSVELTDGDLSKIRSGETPPLCDSVAVMATIVAESSTHVDAQKYQLLVQYLAGPSGARLLGRFAHLHPELEDRLKEYVRAEELLRPDDLFAEIVHLPQGRIGNIAARPILRDYEISYLGRSGTTRDRQIDVADLTVSVRGGRVVLRSLKFDREVRPRLSCAHNFSSGRDLPVYRFLAALQDHGVVGSCAWSWGNHASASFLPRVSRGRIVLSRAMWNLSADDIKAIAKGAPDTKAKAFADWRAKWSVPRYLVFCEGDHRLPIDCDNPRSVESLRGLIQDSRSALLEEMLPHPTEMCVRGPEGRFTNEVVIPLVREKSATPTDAASQKQTSISKHLRNDARNATRRYAPGDEWVYAKLYCGRGSSDSVLRTVVAPLITSLEQQQLISKWFFLRYADPHPHIRIRFKGQNDGLGHVMQLVSNECRAEVANGRISRLVFDTYLPEVERYGGASSVELAESLFHGDSEATLALLRGEANGEAPASIDREMMALAGFDRYFADAALPLPERITLLEKRLGNPPAVVRRSRSTAFRARRNAVGAAVTLARGEGADSWVAEILAKRSARNAEVFRQLRAMEERNELMADINDMLFSFTHMSVNRLLPNASEMEVLLYDFLHRHYTSERARSSTGAVAREDTLATAVN